MTPASRYTLYVPQHVFVEDEVADTLWTKRILGNLPKATVSRVPAVETLAPIPGVKNISLAKQRGPFLRLCPGTSKHICCLYHNLDIAAGCDLGCSYCILQAYLNVPMTTLYTNLDDLFSELDHKLNRHKNRFFRIGTGELSDSLTFDHFAAWSGDLVSYFSGQSNAIIELKSKNTHIDHFINLPHNRRTVVSWSVNAEAKMVTEESHAPSLQERLDAAVEAQKAGFWLGFHFDPMIHHPDWQDGYREVVDAIFSRIDPANIAWISLGALRYPAVLDEIIRENHPNSDIVLGELLPGIDNKYRYFKPLRIEMFNKMYQWIRSYSADVMVYLCMESDEIWQRAFGWSPKSSAGLKKQLDARVKP